MTIVFVDVPNRNTLTAHADNDFQSWKGYGADSNSLAYSARLTALKRTRCIIDQARSFVRKTQGGSFNGHLPFPGAPVIATTNIGQTFKLEFENPVTAIGFDVEPAPQAVVPGQPYNVPLNMIGSDGSQKLLPVKTGNVGSCLFVGTQGDLDSIIGMELRVMMVENNGQETPVNFGVNRLELIASVPAIV